MSVMSHSLVKSFLLAALAVVTTDGCATQNHFSARAILPDDGSHPEAMQRAQHTIAHLFPVRYRATQRAIVTVSGKQFACDGLLTVSSVGGYHLALVSSFGAITDLHVRHDGRVELLKVTPLFRADWSRRFVARDLRWLFISPDHLQPVGRLADGRLVLITTPTANEVTAEYIFSADGSRWQELDLTTNGKTFYRAMATHYLKFPGMATEVPEEFDVNAEAYQLELRITALEPEAQP